MRSQSRDRALEQHLSPEWAAAALMERAFPDLSPRDFVIDAGTGRGAFLKAVPAETPALGVEVDAVLAEEARLNTGRQVITGDFCSVELPQATVVLGNPPFSFGVLEKFLTRAGELLPESGRCGFLLPAYVVQTPSRVLRWHQTWSIQTWMLPRTLFPGSRLPLIWVMLTKEERRRLVGFLLYDETQGIAGLKGWARDVLVHGEPAQPTWKSVVAAALQRLGGRARLEDIYQVMERMRPTANAWWKEQVRKVLHHHFQSVARGEWAIPV